MCAMTICVFNQILRAEDTFKYFLIAFIELKIASNIKSFKNLSSSCLLRCFWLMNLLVLFLLAPDM